jgi:hypothetical protein
MDPALLDMGVDALCGFCVTDEQAVLRAVADCSGIFKSGRMVCMEKEEKKNR